MDGEKTAACMRANRGRSSSRLLSLLAVTHNKRTKNNRSMHCN